MDYTLKSIAAQFRISGSFHQWIPYGSGHIHDTYLVRTKESDSPDYIFQRINHNVFRDIPGLMHNIERVSNFIHWKHAQKTITVPKLVYTVKSTSYLTDHDEYWRCYEFIPDTVSYDIIDTPEQAYLGGTTIGQFQRLLKDFPDPPLNETIPDFHNIEKRLDAFYDAVQKDPVKRVNNVADEIRFVRDRATKMIAQYREWTSGTLPVRIVHNDTKFNNILFDINGKPVAIIDLDTIMPGVIVYDFGDAIRTGCNTVDENESDSSNVQFDIDRFASFSKGFLESISSFITKEEVNALAFSTKYFAYIMGVRFLTDYIMGDLYFNVQTEYQNLDRTRIQFALLEKMEFEYTTIRQIIDNIYHHL